MVKLIVFIDGNIGAGKSTLGTMLAAQFDGRGVFVNEPVANWEKNGLLKAYYDDPVKYAFMFQLQALSDRVAMELTLERDYANYDVVIVERSRIGDKIFADTLYSQNYISSEQMGVYTSLWKSWQMGIKFQCPTITYYVDTPVDQCMANIQSRGRSGESRITEEYLNDLNIIGSRYYKWGGCFNHIYYEKDWVMTPAIIACHLLKYL